jgi:hypothetical protein
MDEVSGVAFVRDCPIKSAAEAKTKMDASGRFTIPP